jgi:hypothetical protein
VPRRYQGLISHREEPSRGKNEDFPDFFFLKPPTDLKFHQRNQQRKEAKYSMTITKIAAVVALAAATLTLGACAHKQAPAPATSVKSK